MNFNPRNYLGKPRIYRRVNGFPRIQKIWVWNPKKTKYDHPQSGEPYRACKRIYSPHGTSKRIYKNFSSTDDAMKWQNSERTAELLPTGPTFRSVVENWRKKKLPQLRHTTRIAYEKMLRLYFDLLWDVPMGQLNAKAVDRWIDHLKDPNGRFMKAKRRTKFDHELDFLSGILRYYREYEDETYLHPIMRRHRKDVDTGRRRPIKDKNLTQEQFSQFLRELGKRENGTMLGCLATVQFYQALRISEAAAIFGADVTFDHDDPSKSRLTIRREVVYPRIKGEPSYLDHGYKNSVANGGAKEQPLFRESYLAVKKMGVSENRGLLFTIEGHHLEYRQVEYAYNEAFKAAGLPFTATHVMRHGGTRRVYRKTKSMETAMQVLGNSDIQTARVYAKGDGSELTAFAQEEWKQHGNLISTDIKRD